MRFALALLHLVETGNAECFAREAPGAGFHNSFATGLADDTLRNAGVAGYLALRLLELEKVFQGDVQDLSGAGLMQLPETIPFFLTQIRLSQPASEGFPFRIRLAKSFRPAGNTNSLAIRATIESKNIFAMVQVD